MYPARFSPDTKWTKITEHWLAVEVLSASSHVYDRDLRRDAYVALGVAQVWLIDRHDASAEVWRAKGVREVVRAVIRWRPPALDLVASIDLREVFAGLA